MKNYVQEGRALDLAAPSGGVVSGNGYLIGSIFGVAAVTAAAGTVVSFHTQGVFDLTSASGSGSDFAAGVKLYWDDSAKRVTKAASGNTFIGHAVAAKGAAAEDAIARVVLRPAGA